MRRDFRLAIRDAVGVDPAEWTPRVLRHSFVSLLSDNVVPLEEISRLVGHSTVVTELVCTAEVSATVAAFVATSGCLGWRPRSMHASYDRSDGLEGEMTAFNPHYDRSALREQDEPVDPGWSERTWRVRYVAGIPGGRTTS